MGQRRTSFYQQKMVLVQSLNLGPIWQASDSLSPRAPGSARRPFLKFAPEPLKMSMEGTREEAYFASKEGVQCLTLVSSSSEKSLSIFGEKLGRLVGWEKRRAGGGDARPFAPAEWANPSITETRSLRQHTPPRLRQPPKRSNGGSKERAVQRKACYFSDRTTDSKGVLLNALAPFYHSSTRRSQVCGSMPRS